MGVWIETILYHRNAQSYRSHPVWVCGLKPLDGKFSITMVSHTLYGCVDWNTPYISTPPGCRVTPCMGVWIETLSSSWRPPQPPVTPCMGVWIETSEVWIPHQCGKSHPVWVCGLKLFGKLNMRSWRSHTLYGCVDWNSSNRSSISIEPCHTLYGCVDWNWIIKTEEKARKRHTLYGCVDWNSYGKLWMMPLSVTPCMGVWIETLTSLILNSNLTVTPCMGVWIETRSGWERLYSGESHPVWVCGLKHH